MSVTPLALAALASRLDEPPPQLLGDDARLAGVVMLAAAFVVGLLEVVFGVLWAWLGAGEAPSAAVLGGGARVGSAGVSPH